MGKLFRAEFWRAADGQPDYLLHCSKCGTRELCFGALPHDIARVHHQFWHPGPTIPVGFANPGGPPPRVCDHRQCPSYECRGC
jgi:hypothetical protein